MVQKLFSLYTHPDESHKLHVEVGSQHIACWLTGSESAFTALEYFAFAYDNTEGGFIDVFREIKRRSILLSHRFAAEEIVWENANFMCIPKEIWTDNAALACLSLVNSQSFQSAPMQESLADYVLAYTADSVLYKIVTENLPQASHTHKLGMLLQHQNKTGKNGLQIQFYQSYFLLTAVKDGVLQLATVFSFQTPQEAVYHILNTLHQLTMPADAITLVSGFIDEHSSLYKELYLYVNNLHLSETGTIKEEFPAHYFTTFNLPVA